MVAVQVGFRKALHVGAVVRAAVATAVAVPLDWWQHARDCQPHVHELDIRSVQHGPPLDRQRLQDTPSVATRR
jgi:hypothetical protein